MKVTAVVMAGGRGSRMEFSEEKPMLTVGGKPVIEHVLTSLLNAKKVSSTVIAVSQNTSKTANFVGKFPVTVVETPGKGYIPDMQYTIKKLNLQTVLAVVSDLPLITSEIVDDVLERYETCGKPALTVAVPIETKARFGIDAEYAFEAEGNTVVPSGINVIDGRLIDGGWMDQEVMVLDRMEVAINVNTPRELKLARKLSKHPAKAQK